MPASSGLFAPYWRSDARGIIAGLTGFTNRHHIARAVLEAVAFQTRDVVDAMIADSNAALAVMKVDGGMTASGLLMQSQADLLGVPVIRQQSARNDRPWRRVRRGIGGRILARL